MTAIPLRRDFDATTLRAVARKTKDAAQARRLLALAAIYEGAMRTEAAKIGDVTLQIVRDWVVKFNAHGPDGLIDRKAPGQPPKLNDAHRAALMKMIEDGPTPAIHGVVRWRIVDLCQWVFEEFRIAFVSNRCFSKVQRHAVVRIRDSINPHPPPFWWPGVLRKFGGVSDDNARRKSATRRTHDLDLALRWISRL